MRWKGPPGPFISQGGAGTPHAHAAATSEPELAGDGRGPSNLRPKVADDTIRVLPTVNALKRTAARRTYPWWKGLAGCSSKGRENPATWIFDGAITSDWPQVTVTVRRPDLATSEPV